MDCVQNEFYYFTNKELYYVLSLIGAKKWYGFDIEREVNIDRQEEFNDTFSKLYNRGLLVFRDNNVYLSKPFETIFNVFLNTEFCILAIKKSFVITSKFFYFFNSSVVSVEISETERYGLRIGLYSIEDFELQLKQDDYFYRKIDDKSVLEKMPSDYIAFLPDKKLKEYLKNYDVISVFEKIIINNIKTTERLIIQEKGLNTFAYLQSHKKSECVLCKDDFYNTVFDKWVFGEEMKR